MAICLDTVTIQDNSLGEQGVDIVRGLSSAETVEAIDGKFCFLQLQWSRGLSSAETQSQKNQQQLLSWNETSHSGEQVDLDLTAHRSPTTAIKFTYTAKNDWHAQIDSVTILTKP